jgi:hypothetical protein
VGIRRVPLVEDRVSELERRAQVRVELGKPASGDEALVDDGPGRRRGHRQLGDATAGHAGCRFKTPARDHQAPLEGVVAERPSVVVAA